MINILFICVSICFSVLTSDPVDIKKTSSTAPETLLEINIEKLVIDDMRVDDTLFVTVDTKGQEISAFDLKFGCMGGFLDIIDVLPGEICDSCRWEFFNIRQIDTEGKIGYPENLWRVIAVAEVVPDSIRPLCYGFDRKSSLLKLVLSSGGRASIPDTVEPIFFLWEGCSDNTVSDRSGNVLMLSAGVEDYPLALYKPDSFPTTAGAPSGCFKQGKHNQPNRKIIFRNGGITFKLDLGGLLEDTLELKDSPENQMMDDLNP